MFRILTAASALALLTACGDGQPFFDEDGNPVTGDPTAPEEVPGEVDGDGGDLDNDGATPPPGSDDPDIDESIFRYEERDGNGGGLVTDVRYNRDRDVLVVDNLAFDGLNRYKRDGTLNGYRIFAADETTDDFLTGDAVGQVVPYRAIYGVSKNRVDGDPRTSFAIVRTGGYISFGFGGYVYDRNGGTVLPDDGQATFKGDYAGVWVYDKDSGMDYITGDMVMDIDFNDFNANPGVKGRITNRVRSDLNGTPQEELENVNWIIEEGVMTLDENGEILTEVFTVRPNEQGALETFFEGTFTGLVAGDTTRGKGGEIVGVLRMEATEDADPLTGAEGRTIQETGGAILYRRD